MKKNLILKLLTFISIAVFLGTFTISSTDKATTNSDIITLIPASLPQAKEQIDLFVSKGYRVKFIVPQSVSTSINDYHYNNGGSYRDIRGGFIVIMEKQR